MADRRTGARPTIWNEDGFREFWAAYPRKVGRLAAVKEWNRLKPDDGLVRQIKNTLAWQLKSEQWQDVTFVPHPRTYLHQGRFEDEPDPAPKKKERAISAAELADAKRQREAIGYCPHDPRCENFNVCVGTIIRNWRKARGES